MDTEDNVDMELYNFIHNKCLNDNIDPKLSVFYSSLATIKSLTYTLKNSQVEHNKKIVLSIACQQITEIVYWSILTYTNNTKLAMFMVERAILLFNEYINVSSIYNIDSTNLYDVKQFIIKKTISPIKLVKTVLKENLYSFYTMWNRFNVNLFTSIANFNQIDNVDCYDILESISSVLLNVSFKLYNKGLLYLINQELIFIEKNVVDNNISSIVSITNTTKLKLELYLYVSNKINNINTVESIVASILDNIETIDNSDFLSTEKDFYSHVSYKKCVELLKTFI